MTIKNKVSIIIPTFKRSSKVKRAINSALRQNYNDFEIIVVDDNNPDSDERRLTELVMREYESYPNVKYIKHSMNRNGSAARNTGIKASKGEFLTFLDDDDEIFPNKILEQVKALNNSEYNNEICYTGYEKIVKNNKIIKSSEKAEGNLLLQTLTKNLFVGSGSNIMITSRLANEISGFNENFKRNQDLEFLVRALEKSEITYVDEVLFLIHYEDREQSYSYEEVLQINNNYRKQFSELINAQTVSERIEIEKTLDLWDLRAAIDRWKILKAIFIYQESNLSLRDVLKYFLYLLKRLITRTSYGFKLN